MRWVIRGYTLVLLAYTGYRTWDFVINQLPAGDTSFWLAILFLFATEIGLAIWHEASISHTTTYNQHYLAVGLTWIDFVGSLGAGIADMMIRQTLITDYAIPTWLASGLIYGLPIIVAINVAGALLFLSNDADNLQDRERRFLQFEAHRQAIKELNNDRSKLVLSEKRKIYRDISGSDLKESPTGSAGKTTPATNGNSAKENKRSIFTLPVMMRRKDSEVQDEDPKNG